MSTGTIKQATSLMARADAARDAERASSHARYVALLVADSGNEKDVAEFVGLTQKLGKSQADIQADKRVLNEAASLVIQLKSYAGATAVAERLRTLQDDHMRWTKEAIRILNEQHFRLIEFRSNAESKAVEFASRERSLRQLAADRPDLLSTLDIPSATILEDAAVPDDAVSPGVAAWHAVHQSLKPGDPWDAPKPPSAGLDGYGKPLPPH